ncbi:MAG: adenosylcobalamin-dependent ribonucleoside-diphosphate reductase [Anaerolineaceae bacterium]|nr:adenosylcobalamin-dependent ribonucleoside-diphosphate reductase [Anaerolineaceae bacterium]
MVSETQARNTELIPTPEIPKGIAGVELSDNARQILIRRYLRKGDDGKPVETIEEMFWRVAYNVARSEENWGNDAAAKAKEFYDLLVTKRFLPNSPTFTGAGTPLGQLAACFVLPISDDMGRDACGIFQTLRDAALIQQTGGGNGFSFSRLRPSGTQVKSSAGQATGPVGFLRVFDHAFDEVAQGGTRRGANMAVLRVDHPDIESFISCKSNENAITNFNISVGITDAFMEAVENDEWWELRFPDVLDPGYRSFSGTFEDAEERGLPFRTYKSLKARDLFQKIVSQAHHNGEPGVLFIDTANRANPVPNLYRLEATYPCGEQWLGPYENCCLGSINLAQHLGENHTVDWKTLRQSISTATQFLDDVIDVNGYVPAVPQLKEAALHARRIGLGIMGLADLMYHVRIRYGSIEGQEFASQVMEFIRYHTMLTSIELARTRGKFPASKGSLYDPEDIGWVEPKTIVPYQHDWGRPPIDWQNVLIGIKTYGIRNAAQTTIAPTGTIATVAGCEGYGCEPVFALAYVRHVNDNGKDLELQYTSPLFADVLNEAGVKPRIRDKIIAQVLEVGTVQSIDELPQDIRSTFVVSADISAQEHIRMQAALQAFVDNSLSKTINFQADASENDIAMTYMLAWKLGCKGTTVYVTGSREKIVLETKATVSKRKNTSQQLVLWRDSKKPRPQSLPGFTYSIETPLGKAFITINENGDNHPFEVFINTAKAGSDTAAVSEAIGRLISFTLRLSSPIEPDSRLQEIITQLSGIGGGRPLGFGPNRVRSLPDGVAQMLTEYLNQRNIRHPKSSGDLKDNGQDQEDVEPTTPPHDGQSLLTIGDLCPECGQAALVNEEGCRKCYACGFSEC